MKTKITKRKRILIYINSFLPGYKSGGPTRSIANLSQILKEDYDVYIVCMNHDTGEQTPYPNIKSDEWIFNKELGLNICYVSDKNITLNNFKFILNSGHFDFLYLNSLWNFSFSTIPLLAALQTRFSGKIILSPRGELNPGALNLKKTKKKLFKWLFRTFRFHKKVIWNATNEIEEKLIRKHFGDRVDVRILSNIPKQHQSTYKLKQTIAEEVKFVFISRITPMKNLIFLLERLRKVSNNLALDILGPIRNNEYWKECLSIIEDLPSNIKVRYLGEIPSIKVESYLMDYHFFVLPTLGENFGHAIFEAWLAGKPVIISNRTPWLKLEDKKIGWDLPLEDKKKWESVLEYCASISSKDYLELSRSSWNFAKLYNSNPKLRTDIRNLFSS